MHELLSHQSRDLVLVLYIHLCFHTWYPWLKVPNFQNPKLLKFKNLHYAYKISSFSSLNCQYGTKPEKSTICLIQHFEADFLDSQPQNPEFRNHPEDFLPWAFASCYYFVIAILCCYRNHRHQFLESWLKM